MNALDKGGRETTTKERERQRQRRETSKVRGVVHTESTSLAAFYGCPQGQALHISVDEPLRSSRVGARLHSPEVSPVQSRHPARAPDGWVGARSKQPPEAAFSCPRMAAVCKGVNPKGCLLLDGEEPRSSSRSIALRCPQKAATCSVRFAAREL